MVVYTQISHFAITTKLTGFVAERYIYISLLLLLTRVQVSREKWGQSAKTPSRAIRDFDAFSIFQA